MKKIAKAKAGTSLGMKSVKAGYDNNPGVTRADIISAAKIKAGKAKNGTKVAAKKPIKKAQNGMKTVDLPQVTKKATSLRPMEIAMGDDRKMSIDTVGYKSPARMRNETFNYTVSDKSGKVIRKDKLQSTPGESRVDMVSRMAKDLESGKMKRPTFKKGGKVLAKKSISKAQTGKLLHKVYTEEEADAMPRSKRAWYTGDGGYGSTGTGEHMTVKDAKKRLKMDLKINDLSRKGIDPSKFKEKVDKTVKKYNKKVAPKAKKGMVVGKCKMGC